MVGLSLSFQSKDCWVVIEKSNFPHCRFDAPNPSKALTGTAAIRFSQFGPGHNVTGTYSGDASGAWLGLNCTLFLNTSVEAMRAWCLWSPPSERLPFFLPRYRKQLDAHSESKALTVLLRVGGAMGCVGGGAGGAPRSDRVIAMLAQRGGGGGLDQAVFSNPARGQSSFCLTDSADAGQYIYTYGADECVALGLDCTGLGQIEQGQVPPLGRARPRLALMLTHALCGPAAPDPSVVVRAIVGDAVRAPQGRTWRWGRRAGPRTRGCRRVPSTPARGPRPRGPRGGAALRRLQLPYGALVAARTWAAEARDTRTQRVWCEAVRPWLRLAAADRISERVAVKPLPIEALPWRGPGRAQDAQLERALGALPHGPG